ncbi:MAG: O-methyltransferase [Bacteroidaceae bacterium]|nr:O-methyltransferase [Bacteroidaceae bacterium]MBQ5730943.1 O-methyltransferase [Bacteroidaceae bacterium]
MSIDERLDDYIAEHSSPEGDYLYRLYRATNIEILNPHMASGHVQGRLLKLLVKMIRPKNILEIGTYTGYSAICMAEGLDDEGKLYTFEVDDELEDFTRRWIEGSPVSDKIIFTIGSALERVPQMGVKFDLAFIDGNKREYIAYYEMALEHLSDGGWILADNTLWDGHVIDPAYKDAQTNGVRAFNDYVRADERVEEVILPLRDGLTIIRKKQ